MFCSNCGTQLPDGARFCSSCGTPVSGATANPPQQQYRQQPPSQQYRQQPPSQQYRQQPPSQPYYGSSGGAQYTDFSPLVDDPEVQAKLKRDGAKTKKIGVVFALLPIVIGVAAGVFSSSIEPSQGLTIGAVVSGVMFLLQLFSKKNPNGNARWEGVVVDKEQKQKYDRKGDSYRTENLIYVKTTDGKKQTIRDNILRTAYDYFCVGDYVRYVPGFNFPYEKRDKSRDGYTICMSCTNKVDLTEDYCPRCHSRVIK